MKVLVADDEPLTNQIVSETLKKWGYDVISTNNGLDAWKLLESKDAPKLAILDWMMPGKTGVEICQQLRERKSGSYIYTILLTGKSDKVDVVEGLAAGADDYLTKPCNPQELRVRLNVGERILRMEQDLMAALESIKHLTTSLNQQSDPNLEKMTPREVEILQLVIAGKSDEEIAKHFQLGVQWVDAHISNILLKLNAPNRQAAIEKAKASNLLTTVSSVFT